MNVLDTYRATALAFANRVRDQLGLPPQSAMLPGIPGNTCNCPLARTIAADVDDLKIEVGPFSIQINGTGRVEMDYATQLFVKSFDTAPATFYPDLVAPEGRFLRRGL